MPDMRGAVLRRFVVAGLLAGLLFAACGSSSPSAAAQVCTDRAQLSDAVSAVVSAARSGNLSQVKSDVSAVTTAFDNLSTSVSQLASEQSSSLRPQIDKLKSTVTGLKDTSSLNGFVTGLDSVRSQVQSISKEIGTTLKCP